MEGLTHDAELDARGLLCPLPILKTRFALDRLQPGEILRVMATDAGIRARHGGFFAPDRKPAPRLHFRWGRPRIPPREGLTPPVGGPGRPADVTFNRLETPLETRRKRLALIATKGELDMAYPPFILASTALAMDYEVGVFFSFYGLQLLRRDLGRIRVSPVGNPAMPMPLPMPALTTVMPGVEALATRMMKSQMAGKGIASLTELRTVCQEGGAKLIACDMTMRMFDLTEDDFIDGVDIGGAATFLDFASEADIQLFV